MPEDSGTREQPDRPSDRADQPAERASVAPEQDLVEELPRLRRAMPQAAS